MKSKQLVKEEQKERISILESVADMIPKGLFGWDMTSVGRGPVSGGEQSTIKRLNLDLSDEQEASSLNLILCFLAGAHNGTMQKFLETIPQVAQFYCGNPLPENKLTHVFDRKHKLEGQDPLELYMSVIETCFDHEDATCHFESTLE